jgi:hypothetical protein
MPCVIAVSAGLARTLYLDLMIGSTRADRYYMIVECARAWKWFVRDGLRQRHSHAVARGDSSIRKASSLWRGNGSKSADITHVSTGVKRVARSCRVSHRSAIFPINGAVVGRLGELKRSGPLLSSEVAEFIKVFEGTLNTMP